MFKIKRTFAFILAVITCMTFCFFGAYAASQKEYFNDYDSDYGESGKSFGLIKISNYGEEDFDTDLEVATQAYNHIYNQGGTATVEVTASAGILMSNHTWASIEDSYIAGSDERIARIRMFGDEVMDGEHYILEVYSTHDMIVTEWMELANGTMGWVELYNESIELSN